MTTKLKVYKKVIQVDFICSYYQRLAHLAYDSDMDKVVWAKPLWMNSICKSNWNIIHDNNPPHSLVLRWFDGDSIRDGILSKNQTGGVITLPVEISYLSKRLDRESKLGSLGID
jgi:hypothetical protein